MNHTYRLVWSPATQRYIPAPETARGRGKTKTGKALRSAALVLGAALALPGWAQSSVAANALPGGAQVLAGQAQINRNAGQMSILQASDKAILQWNSFQIGSQASVRFEQPSASAVALNRVAGGEASQILGRLSANGQVWLVNPNGVLFGRGSQVDVGGLVASTLNITNEDFLSGQHRFTRGGATGSVINQGEINAAGDGTHGGLIALLAPTVSNDGILRAQLGNVALAAGDQVTLQAGANGLLQVQIDPATLRTLVENRQLIVADGGQVLMTGRAADALSASVVANTGTVQARTMQQKEGRILLLADAQLDAHGVTALGAHGTVRVAGLLDASAPVAGHGGFVETSAAQVQVAHSARVTTLAGSSPGGKNGSWLIDPTDFTVSAGAGSQTASGMGADTLVSNLQTGNVTLQTAGAGAQPGDIHIDGALTYSANTLTLQAHNNIEINAPITGGGGLTLHAGNAISATAAVDVGTFTLQAGSWRQISATLPAFNATDFQLASGSFVRTTGGDGAGTAYQIADVYGLQGMGTQLGAKYALARNIDASGTSGWNAGAGFQPVGNSTTRFTGNLDGQGHVINDLKIARPGENHVGLFGYTDGATLRNVALSGGSVTGNLSVGSLAGYMRGGTVENASTSTPVAGVSAVGGLIGNQDAGSVHKASSSASVAGSGFDIGGLVGELLNAGTISQSFATGNVTATAGASAIAGGLVGTNGYSPGTGGAISQSYSTGNVTSYSGEAGGLVGYNGGAISDAYATGAVNGLGSAQNIGGFVGVNTAQGTIDKAYSIGEVTGGTQAGGFAGYNNADAAAIRNAFWDTASSGRANALYGGAGSGIAGKTRFELMNPATFSGWGNAWEFLGRAVAVAGYEAALPSLTGVTRAADILPGILFAGGWGGTSGRPAYAITDWQQLANINQVLAGGYSFSLLNDLDNQSGSHAQLAGNFANGGLGWIPLGHGSQPFVGSFDGQHHTIGDLFINRSTQDYVGLFGSIASASRLRNTGVLTAGVFGKNNVGVLAGANAGDIAQTYAAGAVTGNQSVGGLVGADSGTIADSYASVQVAGRSYAGGLVGYRNRSATLNSYASGSVEQCTFGCGGLIGYGSGAISNAFYATTNDNGAGINNAGEPAGVWTGNALGAGATHAELMNASTFASWAGDLATQGASNAMWRIYEGLVTPLLRGFLRATTVTADLSTAGKTYDGTAASGSVGYSALPGASLLGTLNYTSQGANAGTYSTTAATLTLGGLYSGQKGHDISYAPASLTIDQAALQLSASLTGAVRKTYDGSAQAVLTPGNFLLSGWVASDGANVTQTLGLYDSANAGTGKTVTVALGPGDYQATGTTHLGNYILPTQVSAAVGRIDPAALTIAANNATKTYDGLAWSGGNGVKYSGLVAAETSAVLGGTLSYGGSAQGAVNAGSYQITPQGLASSNYTISYLDGQLRIAPAELVPSVIIGSLAGTVAKTYDGSTAATLGADNFLLTGWVASDGASVTQTTGRYDSAQAGSGKMVTVNLSAGDYQATGSTNLGNYILPTRISGAIGRIDKAALVVSANDAGKTQDGLPWKGGNGVRYQGFVGAEGPSALSGTLGYGGSAQGAIAAGKYQITPLGLDALNYAISYRSGTLTVAGLAPGGNPGGGNPGQPGGGDTGGGNTGSPGGGDNGGNGNPGAGNPGGGTDGQGPDPADGEWTVAANDASRPSSASLWRALNRATAPFMLPHEEDAVPPRKPMAFLTLAPDYINAGEAQ